jgi:hypothetical protein
LRAGAAIGEGYPVTATGQTQDELAEVDNDVEPGHGSESFFIEGEGLLTAARGGREAPATPAGAAKAPAFRFSRMGPKGPRPLARDIRKKVAQAMVADRANDGTIPAGYTYLGQFIDHDLTFDKTTVALGTDVSPADMLQGRSPALDLDSLYGAGPSDPDSERFYQSNGRKLKMGRTDAIGGGVLKAHEGFDLPRGQQKHATIPDKRNDENLAVAQTHLAMIRFHNRVVDELASVPAAQRFNHARRLVVKHYQWMIRHDYLPRICDAAVVDDVFANGRKVFEADAAATSVPTMPIEFSIAAFRLGHSMIRSAYNWNAVFSGQSGTLDLLFSFSGTSGDLGNGVRLPSNWIADWRRLYPFEQSALQVPASRFNHARKIDTLLADPLAFLPPGSFGAKEFPKRAMEANLAFRNLARAKMAKLATGQQMVAHMKSKGVTVKALTKPQLRNGDGGASLAKLTTAQRSAFLERTPLWFYILREAELNHGKLDGVGARIVAETIHRAIEGSKISILRDTAFEPSLGPNAPAKFEMRDLLFFAFEGKKALLAPLGDKVT